MEQNQNRPLLLGWAAGALAGQLKKNQLPFFASLLFGFLAYAFAFTNKLVNHDEVNSLFIKGATVDSGRWGLGLLDSIFPNISMPWIYGIFSIVFIAIAICIIIRTISLKNSVLQVLLAGCIMVFPSLIGTFGYMFTACSFALSFLLAVTAVWFLKWNPKWGLIPALGCMVFSVSIYQSYIAIAASLLVLILIRRLLHGEELIPVIRSGVFYVVFLAASLGIYYVATQFFLWLLDVEMNSYAGGNVSFSLSSIPGDLWDAYYGFLRYFLTGYRGLIPTQFSRNLHLVGIFASFGLLIFWGCKQKGRQWGRFLLIGALILILPLAINCMHLFTTAGAVHTLVLYSFIAVYILAVIIADACIPLLSQIPWQRILRRMLLEAVTVCLAVVILSNIYTANAAFLNLHLRYENAYAFYTSLMADIKMMPEFTEDTKLAILGYYPEPNFYKEHFRHTEQITGVLGFLPDSYSKDSFLKYYVDFPVEFATEAENAAIMQSPEYAEMPVYPYYGCMKLFDNILVVKLSN